MTTVIVTDGHQRSALAIVRSLGSHGYRVVVTAPRSRSIAGASKYAAASFRGPDALESEPSFLEALGRVVAAEDDPILIPVTEAATYAVLRNREMFAGATVPTGDLESFTALCDKSDVAGRAAEIGIAIPRQVTIDSKDNVGTTSGLPPFPLVIKPTRSVVVGRGGGAKHTVSYASGESELATVLAQMSPESFPVSLQQRIEGPGVGVFLLRWNGATLAAFAHRRIREKPPSGGVSVLRESIALDPELLARSEELLDSYRWKGVAMVEYKLDGAGVPFLMEINCRFWGSLQLAIDAGVDFPALLIEAATGAPAGQQGPYRTGVRSRWEWGDIDHLLIRLFRTRDHLDLPPDAPGRARVVSSFLGTFFNPKTRNEIFRLSDPAPFLAETASWFRGRG